MTVTLTFELSKEEKYLLSGNPAWIYVLTDRSCYVPRYRVFVSYSPISTSYYVRFLYHGKDIGLPKDLLCSNRIFVGIPEDTTLKLVVLVEATIKYRREKNDVILCFVNSAKKFWRTYVYDKCKTCNESWATLIKTLALCPDYKREEVSRGKLHEINPKISSREICRIIRSSRLARQSIWSKMEKLQRGIFARMMIWTTRAKRFITSWFNYFWNRCYSLLFTK
ncbi:hypothetical protein BEWA_039010 [Theileria equi strain WA]|uniref:Uncharacterized protein n=1 Tax=Theileria equi strain WA TaxID=1537102 RepID=L1LFD9_THEEQ|nr:hypothetical protein BEWA_039010 [Theileria equi strain WA]EKX73863.1 hypothetical protein BEWA_039010 [Theileria equi strain WA]|eukprot:XP_004833315.1 hypothetical protein BEWA_039010 [Theileria equi strain WA]